MEQVNGSAVYNTNELEMRKIYVGAGMITGITNNMSALFSPECRKQCEDFAAARDRLTQELENAKKQFPVIWALSGGMRVKKLRTEIPGKICGTYFEWVVIPQFIAAIRSQSFRLSLKARAQLNCLVFAYNAVLVSFDSLFYTYDTTQPDIRQAAKQYAEASHEAKI